MVRGACGPHSAESGDLFGHDQMRFTFTVIVGLDPRFECVCAPQPVRFRHGPLPMAPLRFDGVEPRAFAGPRADHDTPTLRAPLALLLMLAEPGPHGMTAMPGGLIPDQQQRHGDRTPGASCHTPQSHLVGLRWPGPPPQPITGQRRGLGIVRRPAQFLPCVCGFDVRPRLVVGLGQATPPDGIAPPQRPRRRGQSPLDQPVAPFFFGPPQARDWSATVWPAATTRASGGGPHAWWHR